MTKSGKELDFISQIKRDGSGTCKVTKAHVKVLENEKFVINRLSLTEDTFIASGFNSFVVRLKD